MTEECTSLHHPPTMKVHRHCDASIREGACSHGSCQLLLAEPPYCMPIHFPLYLHNCLPVSILQGGQHGPYVWWSTRYQSPSRCTGGIGGNPKQIAGHSVTTCVPGCLSHMRRVDTGQAHKQVNTYCEDQATVPATARRAVGLDVVLKQLPVRVCSCLDIPRGQGQIFEYRYPWPC
jgi:hypothetical protein